jgi:hypothetical protein
MAKAALALAMPVSIAASGAAQEQFELQDFVKLANLAFVGKVVRLENEAVPAKNMAFTHVTFAVEQRLFDRTRKEPQASLRLTFAGGHLDDRQIVVSGVPTFAIGDEVVCFVVHDDIRYSSPIIGGDQGMLRIIRDDVRGVRYPLLSGNRGILEVKKGSIVPTDRVAEVRADVIQWQPALAQPATQLVQAPRPVAGSGATTAQVADTSGPRPQRLVDLAMLAQGVRTCDQLIPDTAKNGGTGR